MKIKLNSPYLKACIIFFFVWLLGLLIATRAPNDVLDTYPLLKGYVELMNNFVPVYQYSSKSHFPQVAQLYSAFTYPFYPLYLSLGWMYWRRQTKGGLAIRLQKNIDEFTFGDYCFLLFFAIPFFCILGWVFLFIWNGSDTRMASLGSSKLQLGLIGIFIPMVSAYFFVGAALAIKKIIFKKI